jgi:hypothetical protein
MIILSRYANEEMASAQVESPPVSPGFSTRRLRALTFVLAAASGVSIANIFYSQPLLSLIAQCSVFFGGAIGSALSGVLYEHAGWSGVAILGVVLALIGLAIWAASTLVGREARRVEC